MLHEIALIKIDPVNANAFEQAVSQAVPLFKAAKGCTSMALERIVEVDGFYALKIGWETVENHMVDFRESEDFQKWRALVGHFFTSPPQVSHTQTLTQFF